MPPPPPSQIGAGEVLLGPGIAGQGGLVFVHRWRSESGSGAALALSRSGWIGGAAV